MRNRLLSPALLLVLLMLPSVAPGQALRDDPRVVQALELLERWVDATRAYDGLPGVSMALVHDQELLWSRGFGQAHLEREVPATPGTMYSVCSISKLFTSIAVMQLRDHGKLRLDDPIERHLSWFAIEQSFPQSPPVTIRGILTHSSGLPRESDFPYWTGPDYPFPTRQRVMERLAEQATLYPAETYFQYSNLGLTLAGEIAAAASGRPYADYLRGEVLDPLGMHDTNTEHLDRYRGNRLATGYTARRRDGSREPVPPYEVRGIAPAAGFTSTVEDLARFASWQFRLLEHGGQEILKASTLREMHRVHWVDPDWDTTWGLGFAVWRSGDETFVGHGGYCPGYQSHLLLQPGKKIAAIFMTNTNGVSSRRFTQRAYEIVAPAVAEALGAPGAAPEPDAKLSRYVGRYDDWLAGEEHVLLWGGGLAVVYLPTDDPLDAMIELKPMGDHTFRRIRDDGMLGEEITFEVGPDGQVIRLWRHDNYAVRVR